LLQLEPAAPVREALSGIIAQVERIKVVKERESGYQ
jgi:hypothetical protein